MQSRIYWEQEIREGVTMRMEASGVCRTFDEGIKCKIEVETIL
jgi:hypothetical protein